MTANEELPRISHFLEYRHWEEAVKLLDKQISLMEEGKRHFNTMSMRYYSSKRSEDVRQKQYFREFVQSELFYALSKRFRTEDYPMPKEDGIRIRKYKFLSYRMRLLHYAIGIYLMEVTKDFRNNYYGPIGRLKGTYGSGLSLDDNGRLGSVERNDIYFWDYYKSFTQSARNLLDSSGKDRYIIHFDISNYYDNLSISRLLSKIKLNNKERINIDRRYDSITEKIITEVYNKISGGEGGIPQTDNNIISSFIGNLYMIYADLLVDDIARECNYILNHHLLRWVDDTYLAIDFTKDLDVYEKGKVSTEIAQSISEVLIEDMGLRVNPKTRLFRTGYRKERKEYVSNLLTTSMTEQFASSVLGLFEGKENIGVDHFSYLRNYPKGTVEDVIGVLNDLKPQNYNSNRIESDFSRIDKKSRDTLKMVYDNNVKNLMQSDSCQPRLIESLNELDFDLIYLSINPLLVMILWFKDISKDMEKHFLDKDELSLNDTWISLKYLLKEGVPKNDLYEKVCEEAEFGEIFSEIDTREKFETTGYYDIPLDLVFLLSDVHNAVYQIKNRKLNEIYGDSGIAINYLLNEVHSICFSLDSECEEIKYYNSNKVVNFLTRCGISHDIVLSVRKLFDLRNLNPISHPGSESSPSKIATLDEYLQIRQDIGLCIENLLKTRRDFEIAKILSRLNY